MNFSDIRRYNNRIGMYDNNRYDLNNGVFMNREVPVNKDVGFIVLLTFTERGQFIVPGAVVTIYVKSEEKDAPVDSIVTQSYPITLSLPVSHPFGTLVRGPEYYFTTYDITIDSERFCPVKVNNVRVFPGVTERFDISMIETPSDTSVVPETIIDIPPHRRDILTGQGFRNIRYNNR